jgi:hypothetical protein
MKAPTTACGLPAPLSGRQLTKKCDLELEKQLCKHFEVHKCKTVEIYKNCHQIAERHVLGREVSVQLFWDSRRRYLHLSKEKQGWDLNA